MPASLPTTPAKTGDLSTYSPLFAALAIVVAAWKLFEPKLDRIRAMREEVGHLEFEFRVFYQFPQYLLMLITAGIFVFFCLSFYDSIYPGTLPAYFPERVVRTVLAPKNLFWVVISLSGFGAIIYSNLVPYALVRVASMLAFMPIPGLRGRYGRNGESIGWHQAVAVMEGPDKGRPLLIDNDAVERASNEILARLNKDFAEQDYAAEPADLSDPEKANIALFGCIMEANYYAERWPTPNWAAFYASLADIQRASPMFGPSELLNFGSGQKFFEAFRERLKRALHARQQLLPPEDALAAAPDITVAWDALTTRAHGDILGLIPPFARFVGGPIASLDKRLRGFPKLKSDGMRPQLIKLLVRWHVLKADPGVFAQPFSRQLAWLLLQLGVLRALPDMKEVTFYSTGQVPITRIAALRVIRRVNKLINVGASAEAAAVAKKLGPSSWTRLETSDFILWSWAGTDTKQAVKDGWEKSKWRWKRDDDRIQRNA